MEHLDELCEHLHNGKRGDRGEFLHDRYGPCELRRVKNGYKLTILTATRRGPLQLAAGDEQSKPETVQQ